MDDAARIAVTTCREVAAQGAGSVERVLFVPFGERAEAAFRAALDAPDATGAPAAS